MNYKLITPAFIEQQPDQIVYNDRRYTGNIPQEVLIANGYYPLIILEEPQASKYQRISVSYSIDNNTIVQSWEHRVRNNIAIPTIKNRLAQFFMIYSVSLA